MLQIIAFFFEKPFFSKMPKSPSSCGISCVNTDSVTSIPNVIDVKNALVITIPSIKLSEELSHELGYAFDDCKCHETAGGMLLSVDPTKVEDFTTALTSNKVSNWIVGTIDKDQPGAVRISENAQNIEITEI